ncbi:hypothetical protein [Streptomyces sp. PT19]|uniref:hypothetical protein n=1 Tax=Streptomyces sp. PT19 TaxID=3452239 RepID=UPI003F7F4362
MNDVHPEAVQVIDSLVASRGGHLSYSIGAPGRETAVAAGARLAAESGTPLTVIDFRHLQAHIRSIVNDLHPDLPCTVLAAGEAVQQTRGSQGVWIVHTDLLRAPGIRDALLPLARAADKLITVGRDDRGEPLPDAVAAPRFVLRPSDLDVAAPYSTAALQWIPPSRPDHEQRLQRQISPTVEQIPVSVEEDDEPTLSFGEIRALCQAPDVQQMIAEIEAAARQRTEQAATALATPLAPGLAASRDGRPSGPGAAHHAQQHQTPPTSSPGLRP